MICEFPPNKMTSLKNEETSLCSVFFFFFFNNNNLIVTDNMLYYNFLFKIYYSYHSILLVHLNDVGNTTTFTFIT